MNNVSFSSIHRFIVSLYIRKYKNCMHIDFNGKCIAVHITYFWRKSDRGKTTKSIQIDDQSEVKCLKRVSEKRKSVCVCEREIDRIYHINYISASHLHSFFQNSLRFRMQRSKFFFVFFHVFLFFANFF